MNKIKIGITNCSKYYNYEKWFLDAPEAVDIIRLSYQDNNAGEVDSCDAIVLTGGEDINPALYHKPEYLEQFNLKDIDGRRDDFEYSVIEKSLHQKKPVLCICRGLQVMNVFLGGTLIPDIPTITHINNHNKINAVDQRHSITVDENSLLYVITGTKMAEVNSAHHQSVDKPAEDLIITARAEQPIVEAMQWKETANKSWLLMLQWHPERMPDQENPFASKIRSAFLQNCIV